MEQYTKTKALAELLSIFFGVFIFLWFILPNPLLWFKGVYLLGFAALLYHFQRRAGEGPRDVGLRWDNWKDCAKLALPMTVLGGLLATLLWSRFFPVAFFYREDRLWITLLIYPVWGLLQQYLTLGLMFNRVRELLPKRRGLAVFVLACLFSLWHIPNLPLMFFCFFGELLWGWIYLRAENLFVIALSHGFFGTLCFHVLALNIKVGAHGDWTVWSKLV